jgi:tetratricopeptide (TPR) repeat protein
MDRRDVTSEFVGREPELSQLERHLATAIGGRGQVVLVTGEAGIGKTFLIERFLALTTKRYPDVRIARGQCSERFGGGEGYLPFIEALSTLLARKEQKSVREKVLEIVLDTAPSWLGAVPAVGQALAASFETAQAVRERFGGETSQAIAPDQEHVLQEYAGVLTRLSQEDSLLLFVDDLQWSDAASVDLLVHLSRRIGGNRVLILGTYRPSDVAVGKEGRSHPLCKAVLEMRRYNVCEEVALDRLGRQECEALVSAEFPENDFPASLLELLFGHSEGNALFITEMLRLLIEDGLIQKREGTWHLVQAVEDLPLPRSVESVVFMRIDRLEADLQRALRYASVEGERFLSTVLAQVIETDELQLEERLEIAERIHRLIRSRGELELGWELATVYQFTHILFQETFYGRLKPKERVLLHRRIGLALEALYGDSAGDVAPELALHFTEGRAFQKAFEYSLVAGRAAQRLYAAREAIGQYERAERLLERVGGGDLEQRLAIEEGLGDMRAVLAEYDTALGHYDRAREMLADTLEASERLAGLSRKTAMLYERKGEYDTAFRWLERGLVSVGNEAVLEIARIRLAGAGIYTRQGKHQQAMEWCKSALQSARQGEGQAEVAHATYLLGTIHWHLGRISEMIARAERSLALYEETGDLRGQAMALNNLGIACKESGDWTAAMDYYQRAVELEERLGNVHGVAKVTNNLGNVLLWQGSLGEAAQAYRRSLKIWEAISFPIGVALAWSNMSEVCIERHEWEAALDYLGRSERRLRGIGSDLFLPEVYRRQALVNLNVGQLEEARELVDRSLTLADKLDMTLEKGISLRVSGQIHLARGARAEAEAALRQSLEILRERGNQYQMGQTMYQLGRLYRAAADAGDRAASARAGAAQAGATKAEQVLGEAKEIFERLGAERALARVEEAIR